MHPRILGKQKLFMKDIFLKKDTKLSGHGRKGGSEKNFGRQ